MLRYLCTDTRLYREQAEHSIPVQTKRILKTTANRGPCFFLAIVFNIMFVFNCDYLVVQP